MVERYTQPSYGSGLVLQQLFGWAQHTQFRAKALALGAGTTGLADALAAANGASTGDTTAATVEPPVIAARAVLVHATPRGGLAVRARQRGLQRRALSALQLVVGA